MLTVAASPRHPSTEAPILSQPRTWVIPACPTLTRESAYLSMVMPSPVGDTSRSSTILIVDDDLPFCRAAAELLADRGVRVLGHATTARDAVAECRRLRPDGILLDVQLPDGYGVTLVPELLTVSGPPRIVLMSSDPATVSPEGLLRSGARGSITKAKLAQSDLETLFNGEPA